MSSEQNRARALLDYLKNLNPTAPATNEDLVKVMQFVVDLEDENAVRNQHQTE